MATYASRVVENVTVQPSPQWLQNLLMNTGIRPNQQRVVDVTNYDSSLFWTTNACLDLDKFEDSRIVARDARDGGKISHSSMVKNELTAKILLLQLLTKPVALGMGGWLLQN